MTAKVQESLKAANQRLCALQLLVDSTARTHTHTTRVAAQNFQHSEHSFQETDPQVTTEYGNDSHKLPQRNEGFIARELSGYLRSLEVPSECSDLTDTESCQADALAMLKSDLQDVAEELSL